MKNTAIILIFLLTFLFVLCSCSTNSNNESITVTSSNITTDTTNSKPILEVSLGVTKATELTEDICKKIGIAKYVGNITGVYVQRMEADSLLDATEFRPGDIIQSIDGKNITTIEDIYDSLADKKPGDTVKIEVFRINILNGENSYFDVNVTF